MKLYKHNQTGDQLYCLLDISNMSGLPRWQKVRLQGDNICPENEPFLMCQDGFYEWAKATTDYKAAFEKQRMINTMLLMTNVISFIVTIVVMVIAYNK